ncbi:nicotinic acid phosphoribosyltransferase [Breznakia sp. PF5-3]|uniref:hypothetical protein n=1 Tax=unclassified Breznakia TaxID=2623764 RepID=UPI002404E3DA|nr:MULTISPECIES: hypothetical protein [unclassified Breznakia]MDF9824635.1 nicotinic acid phosphoribosyltransferase [Breznakia sp. PM6-1]MDF9835571.1 nicotinic acid phosphoribosyltransferase [Breznakia sp. PF5-3]MDF9838689.1 nicotinic acid phosphoribosyltransferase [Breznakia sp. PFB2-8]MDF9860720.1 nicotinic acid phosphoribosyltransferase [Breznakia sp. PH5-24]
MIIISCPIKQDFVIETVEAIDTFQYKYEGKNGINLSFSVNTEDIEDAIKVAKAAIKSTEVGAVLYFQVKAA